MQKEFSEILNTKKENLIEYKKFFKKTNIYKKIKDKINSNDLIVQWSVGRGNLAEIPWISIMKKSITEKVSNGIHIDYLFKHNTELNQNTGEIYLVIMLGTNELQKNKHLKSKIQQLLKNKAGTGNFKFNEIENLGTGNLAKKYQQSIIIWKSYSANSIPEDNQLFNDLEIIWNLYNELEWTVNNLSEYKSTWINDKRDNKNHWEKEENIRGIVDLDLNNKNYILFGPPGTSKTYNAKKIALEICNNKEENICFTTFHQSYDYEDFVEGIKPKVKDNNVEYIVIPGIFKSFCEEASKNPDNNYVLIIDEINRGNISKIFGELITLIEPSKRCDNNLISTTLPYSKEKFSVPKNVYIIGTMNTADRSISMMDAALRRRFDFIEMMPEVNKLKNIVIDNIDLMLMLEKINERIEVLYDREHTIGHAYFIELANVKKPFDSLKTIFKSKIIPLLQEYFYEDYHKIQLVLGDYQKTNEKYQFIKSIEVDNKNIFYKLNDDSVDIPEKIYKINDNAFGHIESYIGIYTSDREQKK